MKPHKYFRQKAAQTKRIKEYQNVFSHTDFSRELTDRQKGRMKKVNYCDCGQAKCYICSNELYPIGKTLRAESKKIIMQESKDL